MTIEELKTMSNQLVQAIHDFKTSADYDGCDDEIELERVIDYLLCRLPRDIVYVEWYDRSDIASRCDYDDVITEELLDMCMRNMWNTDESIMDDEYVATIVDDTVEEYKQHKGEQNE